MSNSYAVRVLRPLGRAALERELLEIEGDGAAVARVAAKAHHRLLRAEGLGAHTALLLKQELLALGGDALISPAVYLGELGATTGALVFASDRQLAELTRRLGALPLPALQTLAAEIDAALRGHDAPREPLALPGGALAVGGRMLVLAAVVPAPKTQPDSIVARAGGLMAGGADGLELAFGPGSTPDEALAAVAAAASVSPTLVRDDLALAVRAGVPALVWAVASTSQAALAQLRERVAGARALGAPAGGLVVGLRGWAGAPPAWLGELRALGLPVAADLTGLAGEAEVGAGVALAASAGADIVLVARPEAGARAAWVVGARRG